MFSGHPQPFMKANKLKESFIFRNISSVWLVWLAWLDYEYKTAWQCSTQYDMALSELRRERERERFSNIKHQL